MKMLFNRTLTQGIFALILRRHCLGLLSRLSLFRHSSLAHSPGQETEKGGR